MAEMLICKDLFSDEDKQIASDAFIRAGVFLTRDQETGNVSFDPAWQSVATDVRNTMRPRYPFLVDASMRLMTVPNQWLREKLDEGDCNSAHTYKQIGRSLADWFSFCEANGIDWTKASVAEIVRWRDAYDGSSKEAVSSVTKKPLAVSTRNLRLGYVIQFYEWASQHGFVKQIKFTKKARRVPKREGMYSHLDNSGGVIESYAIKLRDLNSNEGDGSTVRFLIEEEVHQFIRDGFVGRHRVRNKLMAYIMFLVGLRIEEVITLTIHDVPLISGDYTRESKESVITGKGNKRRRIIWPVWLCQKIHEYADGQREHYAALAVKTTGEYPEWLFLTEKGTQLTKSTVQNHIFPTASERTGIECTPHMLRHTFATYHYHYVKDLELLSRLLGHSSVNTTRIYVHFAKLLENTTNVFLQHQRVVDEL